MNFTLAEFFFNIPIYSEIKIDEAKRGVFFQIIDNTVSEAFIGYNPYEKVESTFVVQTDVNRDGFIKNGGLRALEIKCKRTEAVFTYYILWDSDNSVVMKVGQYPSVADFHLHEVKEYTKLLPKEKLKEFTKGIGLAANGVGIGSFVYLRRIFEYLIKEAYDKAIIDNALTEAVFQKARMDQKIDLLHSYLPAFLVENKGMYSILSLGIHELDEDTCLAYFDTLRVGIEIILDEKLDELKKKEKVERAKQKLAEIRGQIKTNTA